MPLPWAGLGPAPTKEGTVSVYAVGAGVLTRPQAFPLQGGRLWRDGGKIPLKLEITSAAPIPPFCILHGTHDSFLMKFSKSRVAILQAGGYTITQRGTVKRGMDEIEKHHSRNAGLKQEILHNFAK